MFSRTKQKEPEFTNASICYSTYIFLLSRAIQQHNRRKQEKPAEKRSCFDVTGRLVPGSHFARFLPQPEVNFIAVISEMWFLKFKFQLTIAFFAAVNHNYGDSQRTIKNRNKQNGSKSTNDNWRTWPFDRVDVNFCCPRGPLRWLTAAKSVNRWLGI